MEYIAVTWYEFVFRIKPWINAKSLTHSSNTFIDYILHYGFINYPISSILYLMNPSRFILLSTHELRQSMDSVFWWMPYAHNNNNDICMKDKQFLCYFLILATYTFLHSWTSVVIAVHCIILIYHPIEFTFKVPLAYFNKLQSNQYLL